MNLDITAKVKSIKDIKNHTKKETSRKSVLVLQDTITGDRITISQPPGSFDGLNIDDSVHIELTNPQQTLTTSIASTSVTITKKDAEAIKKHIKKSREKK